MTASVPVHFATAADLKQIRDDRRVEIVDGEIVEKASPTFEHGSAQAELSGQLRIQFNRRSGGPSPGGWWLATEVEVEYDPHQVYRHDLVGWRRTTTVTRPTGMPIQIRPDWVCEVLSPSNAGNDLVKKLRTLQKHQVPYYWIVNPEHRTLSVMRWTPDGYLTVLTASDTDVVRAEPFDAIELDLAPLFDNEDP